MGIHAKARSGALWLRNVLTGSSVKEQHFLRAKPCRWQRVDPELTLSSPAFCVIVAAGNLPLCFVVHFHHQHDRQISTTCRCALLGSGPQQSRGTTSQEIRRRIVIRLLDIPHSDDTQLLMSFVVGARRDPRCELWLSALDVHPDKAKWCVSLFSLPGDRFVDSRGHCQTGEP